MNFQGEQVMSDQVCPGGFGFAQQVGRSKAYLQSALSGTDINLFKIFGRLVDIDWEMLLHADGRAPAPDIAGEWQELFDVDHFAILVA